MVRLWNVDFFFDKLKIQHFNLIFLMKIKYLAISVAVGAVTLFSACHNHEHADEKHDDHKEHAEADAHDHDHDTDEIEMTEAQLKAACVAVAAIQPSDFSEVVEVSGRIMPAAGSEATVTATMAGIVRFAGAALTDGVQVANGQVLFVVNGKPMADGNPAAVAQTELAAAKVALDRAEKLAAEKLISQRELDDARQRYQTAAVTAQSLGGAAQCRNVCAPIAGYVKNLLVKPGDYVSAGQPLATVTQSRRVQLRADVPERFYGKIGNVVSANFRMAYDEGDKVYCLQKMGGRLVSKGQATDTNDFFVPVTFEFNNEGGIVPGSFAQIYLLGARRSGVLAVPTDAVTEAQGLHFVYVEVHAGCFRRQEVKLGATDGTRTEIVSGLKAGDRVVTRGATQVRLAANASVIPEGHSH